MVRQGKLRDWADRYIHFRKDVKDLRRIDDEYDYFVTGSDQVWNPYFNDYEYLKEIFFCLLLLKKGFPMLPVFLHRQSLKMKEIFIKMALMAC